MAPRPAWKGYLKLSLVTCAVELSGATTASEKVSFRTLNRHTGNAVRRQYIDQTTGKPVSDKNEVRGYEIEKDVNVVLEPGEIDAVKLESKRTIELSQFVPLAEVDPRYVEQPYYVTPADEYAAEGYLVIREALRKTGRDLSREKLVNVLETTPFDLGGYKINYSPANHNGSRFVDLTVLGRDGRVLR